MSYYRRACVYKDLRKYEDALRDFRSYLKYGSELTAEGIASRVSIEELEIKLRDFSELKGERSEVICPWCRCNLVVVDEPVDGFADLKKLRCPECGQITVKL